MIRSLWIAKTGLDAQQTNLDVISNNLANASTTGYKKVKPIFEDLLYQTLRQAGAPTLNQQLSPSGLQVGVGVRPAATERIFIQGALNQTQNPLDVAINGNGFFMINMPDGTVSYSRDGNLTRDQNGQLVNSSGLVLAPGITIPVIAQSISISPSGQVSYTTQGTTQPTIAGQISLYSFANPTGLNSIGGNLYQETAASGTATQALPGTNGMGTIQQYYVEQSNVNVAEELVNMITAQRGYEINTRAIKASDEMLQTLTQL